MKISESSRMENSLRPWSRLLQEVECILLFALLIHQGIADGQTGCVLCTIGSALDRDRELKVIARGSFCYVVMKLVSPSHRGTT